MNAAVIINLLIFLYVACLMIGIGISNLRSTRPVGFYSGEQPPAEGELTDVRAWNHKHGWMWIVYGASILISSAIGCCISDNPWCILPFFGGTLLPLPIMIWYHHKLMKRYKK